VKVGALCGAVRWHQNGCIQYRYVARILLCCNRSGATRANNILREANIVSRPMSYTQQEHWSIRVEKQ